MLNHRRDESERGQILVIVAVGLVAIIAMVALVIDGGYAWARQRDTQNAADAAAEAGATILMQNVAGVSPAKTDGDVKGAVDQAADENGTIVDVAFYTDIDGNMLTPAGATTTDETAAAAVGDGVIPPGAAGVRSLNEQEFDTFLAQVLGFRTFTAREDATAVTGYLEGICSAAAGCNVLPVTFPVTIYDCDGTNSVVYQTPAAFWPNPSAVTVVPLCAGNSPGNTGWIDWTPTAGGASELEAAITTPSNPALNWPDWHYVTQTGGPDSVEAALRTWDGKVVMIPLFDGTCDDTPTGPGLTDCPVGESPATGNGWYHFAAMTSFELCGPAIPECVSAGYSHGSYVQGSNGSFCNTGNGATDCLVGRFKTTSFSGQVTAAPGPDPNNQTLGIQLIK
jgi:Flp pilus assembly protein TadG